MKVRPPQFRHPRGLRIVDTRIFYARQSGNSPLNPPTPTLGHGVASRPFSGGMDRRSQALKSTVEPHESFLSRHVGATPSAIEDMLKALDPPVSSMRDFVKQVIPPGILSPKDLKIARSNIDTEDAYSSPLTEPAASKVLQAIGAKNKIHIKSLIGCGYADCHVPQVIKRNVLEEPGWYTSYTPYQPEISQGRLESLLNYQTMVSDLTGLPISNASILDEGTAAAEAMTLSMNALSSSRARRPNKVYAVSNLCHPQTIAVLQSRAEGFGISIKVLDVLENDSRGIKDIGDDLIGVLAQYPDTQGKIEDFASLADVIHELGATFCVATDLLALTLLKPPGEFGADVAFGNAQRFGVPLGYGGPHAAFFACTEKHKRKIPGRLIGVSKDRLGDKALRLALQTREQHIRREKATSNICTAQALLANMSAFYAIFHGPSGLRAIAEKISRLASILDGSLRRLEYKTGTGSGEQESGGEMFDTVVVEVAPGCAKEVVGRAEIYNYYLRVIDDTRIGITLDETVEMQNIEDLVRFFREMRLQAVSYPDVRKTDSDGLDIMNLISRVRPKRITKKFARSSTYLTHPVFNTHHSETEALRYIRHLQSKDLSLIHSMIPLGSCTMKLNATTELAPLSWPEFNSLHPFVPLDYALGYKHLIRDLEGDLAEITGLPAVSLQPNSGAQGEFTGLRVIRKYHETQPGKKRDICLIPVSAHGTNPASAAMAGMRVVSLKCEAKTGNLELADLKEKCEKYSEELGAIMITYPSTFGVFEPNIKEVCKIVHSHGGQVYMDGANMNAQIGLCSPGEIGADVCHLNLHKTFCIPHGGGGPGIGPICAQEHLAPFMPGHPLIETGGEKGIAPVSAAPWGSASLLPISWAYIKMMGGPGLTHATKITLLNANYILTRLRPHYEILYTNEAGRCAHEFILDARPFKDTADIEAIDIAKRLQDYGFHAPTMSWPVANTLMIEPTESESKAELDRFCDAMISIRQEIKAIEDGKVPKEGNVLKMAPHSMKDLLLAEPWDRCYSRETAAYPLPWLKEKKFWPSVTRLDDSKFPPWLEYPIVLT